MSRGFRFVTLMLCFAVAGCASMSGQTPANAVSKSITCTGAGPCPVPVTYEFWLQQCFFHCEVFAPETVEVDVATRQSPPPPIVWTLPPDTYFHFAADGIQFEDPNSGFTCPSKSAPAQRDGEAQHTFTCDNAGKKSPDAKGWKYWIRLEYGLVKHKLDPWVFNR